MKREKSSRRSARYGMESLESRLALAGVVSFIDVDGDSVTVKSSKGTTADLQAALILQPSGSGSQLRSINLTSPVFQGTSLSVTAVSNGWSEGRVHVGQIDATGRDLKAVTVAGDLGRIQVGDGTSATPAFSSLTLQSLGAYGVSTGATNLETLVTGRAGNIKIQESIFDATILQFASTPGPIKSLSVGGSLVRGLVSGNVSSITVGADVVGGAGENSGVIFVSAKSISIGGYVAGSTGLGSGRVISDSGKILIKGAVIGAVGSGSGAVQGKSIVVEGDVSGGTGARSGSLSGLGAAVIEVKGSMSGGGGDFSGWVIADTLKSISVGGSVTGLPFKPVGISAESSIGSVKIGGILRRAIIRAGFGAPHGDYDEQFDDPSVASIGSVAIAGNCIESSIVAGATPGVLGYGLGDTVTAGNTTCAIGAIKIGGGVGESTALTTYGFVGRSIKSLSISGQKRMLPQPGQSTKIDDLPGYDVFVHII